VGKIACARAQHTQTQGRFCPRGRLMLVGTAREVVQII
jgi:hypothetical protein